MITLYVPGMSARQDVRTVSASISDVPGVRTLQADLATHTVHVTGPADPAAVTAALTALGYAIEPATARTGGPPVDTCFSTDISGLTPGRRGPPSGRLDGSEPPPEGRIPPGGIRLRDAES